jgi:hypothetical protein
MARNEVVSGSPWSKTAGWATQVWQHRPALGKCLPAPAEPRTDGVHTLPMRFRTVLETAGKTATGIPVPPDVVDALDAGKRPPVAVTINDYTWRTSVAVMGGRYMVGVSAQARERAAVQGGDEIEVDIKLDTEPRDVAIPEDFAQALSQDPAAVAAFEATSYSNKRRLVMPIDEAKTPETRQRRITKTIAGLRGA